MDPDKSSRRDWTLFPRILGSLESRQGDREMSWLARQERKPPDLRIDCLDLFSQNFGFADPDKMKRFLLLVSGPQSSKILGSLESRQDEEKFALCLRLSSVTGCFGGK